MQDNDLKSIIVTISGRKFPIKVTPSEELFAYELEQELNEKVSEMQQNYPGKDKLDSVIMTLLTYTFDQKKPSASLELDEALDKIKTIKSVLHDIIVN